CQYGTSSKAAGSQSRRIDAYKGGRKPAASRTAEIVAITTTARRLTVSRLCSGSLQAAQAKKEAKIICIHSAARITFRWYCPSGASRNWRNIAILLNARTQAHAHDVSNKRSTLGSVFPR